MLYNTYLRVLRKGLFTQNLSEMEPGGSVRMLVGSFWLQQSSRIRLPEAPGFAARVHGNWSKAWKADEKQDSSKDGAPPVPSQLPRVTLLLVRPPISVPFSSCWWLAFSGSASCPGLSVSASASSGLVATSLSVESFQLLLLQLLAFSLSISQLRFPWSASSFILGCVWALRVCPDHSLVKGTHILYRVTFLLTTP